MDPAQPASASAPLIADNCACIAAPLTSAPPTDADVGLRMLELSQTFYQNAWTNLLWVVGVLGALAGLVLPFYLEWHRSRAAKRDLEQAKNELRTAATIDAIAAVRQSVGAPLGDALRRSVELANSRHEMIDTHLQRLEREIARCAGDFRRAARLGFEELKREKRTEFRTYQLDSILSDLKKCPEPGFLPSLADLYGSNGRPWYEELREMLVAGRGAEYGEHASEVIRQLDRLDPTRRPEPT